MPLTAFFCTVVAKVTTIITDVCKCPFALHFNFVVSRCHCTGLIVATDYLHGDEGAAKTNSSTLIAESFIPDASVFWFCSRHSSVDSSLVVIQLDCRLECQSSSWSSIYVRVWCVNTMSRSERGCWRGSLVTSCVPRCVSPMRASSCCCRVQHMMTHATFQLHLSTSK